MICSFTSSPYFVSRLIRELNGNLLRSTDSSAKRDQRSASSCLRKDFTLNLADFHDILRQGLQDGLFTKFRPQPFHPPAPAAAINLQCDMTSHRAEQTKTLETTMAVSRYARSQVRIIAGFTTVSWCPLCSASRVTALVIASKPGSGLIKSAQRPSREA
jgi:hypothetical protein